MKFLPGPGLGGHCIPIDPFYLTWKAQEVGMPTRFIELAGQVNRGMPKYVVNRTMLALNDRGKAVKDAKILVLGLAYKPDVDDVRESPALDVIGLLEAKGARVEYHDPYVARTLEEGEERHSVPFTRETVAMYDCVVITTDHSGVDYDLRRDHRYAPYDRLEVESPCLTAGDVAARVWIRADEIRHALRLLEQLLEQLPEGPVTAVWPAAPAAGEGLGLVEGWRGEIVSYIRLGADGRVLRFFPRDPSWFSWPALERLIDGNIVADFPVCNKSINASYSGHDL